MTTQPAGPLDDEQRRRLVGQAVQAVIVVAAPGWRRLRLEYRAVGRHVEADLLVTGADGTPAPVPPPPRAVELLGGLRVGMYRPGRGTWLAAVIVADPGRPPRADYHYDQEPRWRRQPPRIGYQDELRFFPRADENVPAWWRQRAGLPAAPASPADADVGTGPAPGDDGGAGSGGAALRTPRVFDALGDSGDPVVERAPLDAAERERVLDYLGAAPVVLAARGHDTDAFDPDRPPSVPLTFRTDGAWVWPGAVAYYLREHGVAPDPEFLAHIRARGYTMPEVSEPARELAVATVTGGPVTGGPVTGGH